MVRYAFLCTFLIGCSFGDDRPTLIGVDAGSDGPPGIDAPPPPTGHLLITEVKSTGPSGATTTGEFIEIWNPTNRDIALDNYYLSDVGDYWKYPASSPNGPNVLASDFIVRFPAGAVLASDGVITVATVEADVATATYAVNAVIGTKAMAARNVPSNTATITNSNGGGEVVVLFYWDGVGDLVKDVDIVLAGVSATPANSLLPKVAVDGPDADVTATAYQPDNGLLGGYMNAETLTADGTSYKRRSYETGSESQAGTGNGITGDDETSEALKSTWDGDLVVPLSAPTPGVAPVI
jgi:Lamin Tail Domain